MSETKILRIGGVKNVAQFAEHLRALQLRIPCDSGILLGAESPLFSMVSRGSIKLGIGLLLILWRGGTGARTGRLRKILLRRWRRFGASGAKLIWGGEAVAVSHVGRANRNQLVIAEHTRAGLAQLRAELVAEHKLAAGSDSGCWLGCSYAFGRYCKPNSHTRAELKILQPGIRFWTGGLGFDG